MIFFSSRIPHA